MKKINKYDVIKDIVLVLILLFIQIVYNELIYRTDWLSTVYGMALLFTALRLNELLTDIMNGIRLKIELNKITKELDKILEDLRKELTNEGVNKDDSK